MARASKTFAILVLTGTLVNMGMAQNPAAYSRVSYILASDINADLSGQSPQETPSKTTIKGTVESVDKADTVVQIKKWSGGTTVVQLGSGAQILKNGKPVQLSDLKPGDPVTVITPF